MQRAPDPVAVAWLDAQPTESLWTTSITVFEVRFGIELLAQGRRRRRLERAFAGALEEDFGGRVVSVDESAAHAAGVIAARLRARGRPVEIRDVLIAGIAVARKATVATRNVKHFEPTGVSLTNPWD